MNRVEKYLKYAFDAIKDVAIAKDNNTMIKMVEGDVISKVFKGYISSLGANIIQAGIKIAVYFYEAKESGSTGDKRLVTASIHYILQKAEGNENPETSGKLSSRLQEGTNLELLSQQVMDAATALKLAIRTYKND